MTAGIVLFGPPAAGKDTITALAERRSRLRLVRKIKAGSGQSTGYRLVDDQTYDAMAASGDFISTVARYGNRYAIP